MGEFDYIVVGAGSAGCVLANRLSADPANRVLLVEAGPPDRSFNIHMPAGIRALLAKPNPYNWFGETAPQAALGDRRMYWPTGRGWGGTSSINGMAYIRGHPEDFDRWAQAGLPGWSFADVLPYFRRAEANVRGAGLYHGGDGPLHVSDGAPLSPLASAFVAAGLSAGHPVTDDFNGPQPEGFGALQLTTHRGRRWSTASAYLRPALRRPNLTVASNALVTRILFDGTTATGIAFTRGGRPHHATARREVVLAAGVTRSPQLLMLSGVGDAHALRDLGIPVVADRPMVGRNLQDHIDCVVSYTCTQPITLYNQTRPLAMLLAGLEYLLFHRGPATGIGVEAYAFLRSREGLASPDLQVSFVNALMEGMDIRRHGFMMHLWHLRPDSRGTITLASRDAADHPVVQPHYFTAPEERRALREGIKLLRNVIAQPAFDPYRGEETSPGPMVRSDAEIDAFLTATATGLFHPVGTAAMGRDEDAVTDAALRVRGVDRLRVADAAVMPNVVSGNTNAAVIMIAEKAADMILGCAPLPAADV